MKTLKVLIVALCLTAFATTALAEEPKTELALNKRRIWHAAAIPLHFLVHLEIHEATHVATGLALGWKLKEFKPYPNITNGLFYFGYSNFKAPTNQLGTIHNEIVLETMTPYMLNAVMFITADILLSSRAINPKSVEGAIVFTAGMVAPWVDTFFNVNNVFTPNSDFTLLTKLTGENRYAIMVITDAILIIAGYRIVSQFINVFYDRRPVDDEPPPAFTLAPLVAPGFSGAAANFVF